MRVKSLVSIFVIALMAFGLSLSLSTQDANADGATVAMEFGCGIAPADWGGPFFLFTTESHAVVTPSGNTKLTCHFEIPWGLGLEPARAHKITGFLCGTFAGLTTNTQSISTPGGNVILQCIVNGSN